MSEKGQQNLFVPEGFQVDHSPVDIRKFEDRRGNIFFDFHKGHSVTREYTKLSIVVDFTRLQ
jgi:hypothetical protein